MKENMTVMNRIKFNTSFREQKSSLSPQAKKQLQKEAITLFDQSSPSTYFDADGKINLKQGKKLLKSKAKNISVESNEKFLKNLQHFYVKQVNDHPIFKKTQRTTLKNNEQQDVPSVCKGNRCSTSIQIEVINQCEHQQESHEIKKIESPIRSKNYSKLPTLNSKNDSKEQKEKKKKQFLNLKYYLKQKQLSLLQVQRKFSRSFSLLEKTNQKQLKKQKDQIKRLRQNFKEIYLDKTFLETKVNKSKLKQKILRKESNNSKKQWNRDRKKDMRAVTENISGIQIISNKKLLASKSNEIYKSQYKDLLANFLQRQRIKTEYIKDGKSSKSQFKLNY